MYWYREGPSQNFKEYYGERNKLGARLKRTFAIYTILGFIGFSAYFLVSGINYVDVSNFCFIKIKHDVVIGEKQSIIDAIKAIKAEDYVTYKNVCMYANKIYERDCLLADNDTPQVYTTDSEGCYIRGSRSVFVEPVPEYSDELVQKRKTMISHYAEISAKFWQSKK